MLLMSTQHSSVLVIVDLALNEERPIPADRSGVGRSSDAYTKTMAKLAAIPNLPEVEVSGL